MKGNSNKLTGSSSSSSSFQKISLMAYVRNELFGLFGSRCFAANLSTISSVEVSNSMSYNSFDLIRKKFCALCVHIFPVGISHTLQPLAYVMVSEAVSF